MTQILAIDQGTTNSKAVLVDDGGVVRAVGSAPVGVTHPRPGWVEQDAEQLWTSVLTAIDRCLSVGRRRRPRPGRRWPCPPSASRWWPGTDGPDDRWVR